MEILYNILVWCGLIGVFYLFVCLEASDGYNMETNRAIRDYLNEVRANREDV